MTARPTAPDADAEDDGPAAEAIAAYREAAGAGAAPAHDEWLRRYPAAAPQLAAFFRAEALLAHLRGAAAPAEPELGRFGDYELEAEIGRGGMGVVYRARHVGLGRVVALKMIAAGRFASAAEVGRFRAEAAAAVRLDHPHVVPVYEAGEAEGRPYFTMKLVDGASLADELPRLARDRPAGVRLLESVARGVDHAHRHGVLHRDLKPANILVGADGTPYVTDFGLAKRLDAAEVTVTAPGAAAGTLSYMAPEQLAGGRALTTAADVYALGVILFQILTGRRPFRAPTLSALVAEVAGAPPPRPRGLNPAVDRDLETVCLKCLEQEPGRRYASAGALADDLARWRRGEPVLARPVGRAERVARWARRRPWAAGALLAVALGGAAAFAGVTWAWREAVALRDRADAARGEAEMSLYVGQIALADRELAAGSPHRAAAALDACPPARRGWEWRHLSRLCRGAARTSVPAGGAVTGLQFRADGAEAVASGGAWNHVSFFPVPLGPARSCPAREVRRSGPAAAAYAPGGGVVAGLGDGEVGFWDAAAGRFARKFAGLGRPASAVAVTPDGSRVLAAAEAYSRTQRDGVIVVWDAATGEPLHRLAEGSFWLNGMAVSPDGAAAAAVYDGARLTAWSLADGRPLFDAEVPGVRASAVAFAPDGRTLLAASSASFAAEDGVLVTAWDYPGGRRRASRAAHEGQVCRLAFAPDGRRFVSASEDRTVLVWDADSLTPLLPLRGHADEVRAAAFSPDGDTLLTGSGDRTVAAWDGSPLPEGEPAPGRLGVFAPDATAAAVALSGDGRRLAVADPAGRVEVWDRVTGERVAAPGAVPGAVLLALSGDGSRVACTDFGYRTHVWAVPGGAALAVPPPTSQTAGAFPRGLSLDRAGGRLAASAGWYATVADVGSAEAASRWSGPVYELAAATLSPDGTLVAGADEGHVVRVRRASGGLVVRELAGHAGTVRGLAFSPDGRRLASAGTDRTVRVWDLSTGVATVLEGHTDAVLAVAFEPCGGRVASAGVDRTVRVWEAGRVVATFPGHPGPVRAVAFDPSGAAVVAVCCVLGRPQCHVWACAPGGRSAPRD